MDAGDKEQRQQQQQQQQCCREADASEAAAGTATGGGFVVVASAKSEAEFAEFADLELHGYTKLDEDYIPPQAAIRRTASATPAGEEPHDALAASRQEWCYLEKSDADPEAATSVEADEACARLDADSSFIRFRGVSVWFLDDLLRRIVEGAEAPHVRLMVCRQHLSETTRKGDTIQYIRHFEDDIHLGEATQHNELVKFSMSMVQEKPRRAWTIEDICQQVVLWRCFRNGRLFLDLLNEAEKGRPFQGAFVCQARSSCFADFVDSLVAYCRGHSRALTEQFVWLDIFCVNQTRLVEADADLPEQIRRDRKLVLSSALHQAIRRFDDRLIFLDSWRAPTALTRAWCVWEIYGIVRCGCNMHVLFAPGEQEDFLASLMRNYDEIQVHNVNMRQAECNNSQDLIMIHRAIEDLDGGYDRLNAKIVQHLRQLFVSWTQRAVDAKRREARGETPYQCFADSEQSAGTEQAHRHDHFEPWVMSPLDFSGNDAQHETLLLLARLLSQAARFIDDHAPEVALEYYNEALQIYETSPTPKVRQCAAVENNIAIVLRKQGEIAAAVEHLRKALALQQEQENRGRASPLERSTTLNNLGRLYFRLQRHEDAVEAYQASYAIRVKELGRKDPQVASVLGNIAMVQVSQRRFRDALEAYTEALHIKVDALGEGHPHVATTLNSIAHVHASLGDCDLALENYNRALTINCENLGPRSTRAAWTMARMAPVLRRCARFEEALENLTTALQIQRENLGDDAHVETADTRNEMAVTLRMQGRPNRAKDHAQASLDARRALLGGDHPQVAASLWNLALIFEDLGLASTALAHAEDALRIRLRSLGAAHDFTRDAFDLVSRLTVVTCASLESRTGVCAS